MTNDNKSTLQFWLKGRDATLYHALIRTGFLSVTLYHVLFVEEPEDEFDDIAAMTKFSVLNFVPYFLGKLVLLSGKLMTMKRAYPKHVEVEAFIDHHLRTFYTHLTRPSF